MQISLEYQKKQRKLFKLTDIIYKPTKRIEIEPLHFFFERFIESIFVFLFGWEKEECNEHIEFISVITAINLLLTLQSKKIPAHNGTLDSSLPNISSSIAIWELLTFTEFDFVVESLFSLILQSM